ncbi:hypothetical protein EDB86DRAFT_3083397 [Lactarius hatsudake]|nr:hypothetical protein EDB86DRAFT_3083397 [Lactarius hatsudake]
MPSVGSGKTKVKEEEDKRKAVLFVLNKIDRPGATRECTGTPEAPLRQDLNTSLSLRAAPTSARISPLLHTPTHHHLQVPGPYIAVGFVGFWTSAKVASSTHSSTPITVLL